MVIECTLVVLRRSQATIVLPELCISLFLSRARCTHPRLRNPNNGVCKRDGLSDHVSTYLSMDGSVGEAFMILILILYVETDDSQGATFFGYMGIAAALVFCSKFLIKLGIFPTE